VPQSSTLTIRLPSWVVPEKGLLSGHACARVCVYRQLCCARFHLMQVVKCLFEDSSGLFLINQFSLFSFI